MSGEVVGGFTPYHDYHLEMHIEKLHSENEYHLGKGIGMMQTIQMSSPVNENGVLLTNGIFLIRSTKYINETHDTFHGTSTMQYVI